MFMNIVNIIKHLRFHKEKYEVLTRLFCQRHKNFLIFFIFKQF